MALKGKKRETEIQIKEDEVENLNKYWIETPIFLICLLFAGW